MYRSAIVLLLISSFICAQNTDGRLTGRVINKTDSLPISDCSIIIPGSASGTTSDTLGFFSIPLPPGSHTVKFSHLGFETLNRQIELSSGNSTLNITIELNPSPVEKDGVVIYGEKEKASLEKQTLGTVDIKNMPAIYQDALRTVQILPGVTSNNELSSSYNVRGGNLTENIILLNGYEIYRPFFLKQGIEENQSLINPDMVREIRFYAGNFPARFGDRLSSALEVSYSDEFNEELHGSLRGNLLNMAAGVNNRYGNFNWTIGFRYAYPDLFQNKLQTTGLYEPSYIDVQGLFKYAFSPGSDLEMLIIAAENKYDLSPIEFKGYSSSGVPATIKYKGYNNYSFNTGLLGLKYTNKLNSTSIFSVSFSRFHTNETENTNNTAFMGITAEEVSDSSQYSLIRYQSADNRVKLTSNEIKLTGNLNYERHSAELGAGFAFSDIYNLINESMTETGSAVHEIPYEKMISHNLNFNSFYLYGQDRIILSRALHINAGLRYLHYAFTREDFFSPRLSLSLFPYGTHSINLSFGYYYQPPFYYELWNKPDPGNSGLKSQRAIFYSLGWDYLFAEKVKFQLQAYYKKLDRLIPFYIGQLKVEYADKNSMEGYAYGLDLQFQGRITKQMQSWIGYSYLNSRERGTGSSKEYLRRFLDQTHTFQVFLQDNIPKHPNWQSHLRLLFGSGFLYPDGQSVTDSSTGKSFLSVNMDDRHEFHFYMRADMGLTVNLKVYNDYDLRITLDVLNVFDNNNVAGIIFIKPFPANESITKIPQLFTGRVFNIGAELRF